MYLDRHLGMEILKHYKESSTRLGGHSSHPMTYDVIESRKSSAGSKALVGEQSLESFSRIPKQSLGLSVPLSGHMLDDQRN